MNAVTEPVQSADPRDPTPAQISLMVDSFYSKVRHDPLLEPVFVGRVSNWPAHQEKMVGFWRSVLLGTKEYKGHLMAMHARLPGIAPAHFERWLELFDQALHEALPPEALPYTRYIAQRFARALQLGLFTRHHEAREPAPTFEPSKLNADSEAHHKDLQGVAAC